MIHTPGESHNENRVAPGVGSDLIRRLLLQPLQVVKPFPSA
jgi:hypothetical protein